LSIFRANC